MGGNDDALPPLLEMAAHHALEIGGCVAEHYDGGWWFAVSDVRMLELAAVGRDIEGIGVLIERGDGRSVRLIPVADQVAAHHYTLAAAGA